VLRRAISPAVAPPSEGLACFANAVQAAPNSAAATPPPSALNQAHVSSALHVTAPKAAACHRRGLTGRSRGRATARRPGRAAHRPIMRRTAGPPCCRAPLNSALGHTGNTPRVARSGHAQRAAREFQAAPAHATARPTTGGRAERGEEPPRARGTSSPLSVSGFGAAHLQRPTCSGHKKVAAWRTPGFAACIRATRLLPERVWGQGHGQRHRPHFERRLRWVLIAIARVLLFSRCGLTCRST